MRYPIHVHLFIPLAAVTSMNTAIKNICKKANVFPTFVRRFTNPSKTQDCIGVSIKLNADMKARLDSFKGTVPAGVKYFIIDASNGTLIEASNTVPADRIGRVWQFEDSVNELLLTPI